MVVHKATNVEPVGPVQHLQFQCWQLLIGKNPELSAVQQYLC
jgi:hypothetical protein